MEENLDSAIKHLAELERRISENPKQRATIIQTFYRERVEAGETRTAHIVLSMRQMMDSSDPPPSKWFQVAGFGTGLFVLLFFMALSAASIFGYSVPPDGRFLVLVVFALGSAFSAAFLTGDAATSGKIPFFGDQNPLAIIASGGIAVLIIILAIGYYIYL